MMQQAKVFIVVGFLLSGITPAVQSTPSKQTEDCRRLIVKYRDTDYKSVATTRQIRRMQTAAGNELKYAHTLGNGAYLLYAGNKLTGDMHNRQMIAALNNEPDVEYAECDARRYTAQVPNDTDYDGRQWYLRDNAGGIRAEQAWNITMGESSVVTAVVDSGIQKHPQENVRLLDGYDFVSPDSPGNYFTANDGDGRDDDESDPGDWANAGECPEGGPDEDQHSSWHGTFIAGIIGAETNNGNGIAGIDWEGYVLPVRAIGKCGGSTLDIAEAVRWAAGLSISGVPDNPNPADVINLSLGASGDCLNTEREAIQAAIGEGALVVVAAGNSGTDVNDTAPANCDVEGMVVVAATTMAGAETCYTNFGDIIDLSAPGGNDGSDPCVSDPTDVIYSTSNTGTEGPQSAELDAGVGTSFATPMVAGAGALLRAAAPTLTPVQLESILKNSTRAFPENTLGGFGDCTQDRCGTGILDINQALVNATGADVTPEPIAFTDQDEIDRNTTVESNAVTASGIDTPVPVGVSGGLYSVNDGAYTDDDGYVQAGDSITVQLNSSSSYSTTSEATLTVGNISDTFSVTTVDPPPPPDNDDDGGGGGGGGGGHPAGLLIMLLGIATGRTAVRLKSLLHGPTGRFDRP